MQRCILRAPPMERNSVLGKALVIAKIDNTIISLCIFGKIYSKIIHILSPL